MIPTNYDENMSDDGYNEFLEQEYQNEEDKRFSDDDDRG